MNPATTNSVSEAVQLVHVRFRICRNGYDRRYDISLAAAELRNAGTSWVANTHHIMSAFPRSPQFRAAVSIHHLVRTLIPSPEGNLEQGGGRLSTRPIRGLLGPISAHHIGCMGAYVLALFGAYPHSGSAPFGFRIHSIDTHHPYLVGCLLALVSPLSIPI